MAASDGEHPEPDTAVAQNGEPAAPPAGGGGEVPFQQPTAPATSQHIDKLAEYDLPQMAERTLEAVLDPDFMLSNLTPAEVHELKYELRTAMEMTLASFPPQESALQGEIRKEFGFEDGKTALTPDGRGEIINGFRAAWTRVARSRNGWQQELLAEQTQVRRVEDEREEKQGIMQKLLGG